MAGIARSLRKRWWFLHRFGLTPPQVYHRFSNRGRPRILCLTVPKAGTNLLERSLCLSPGLHRRLLPTVTDNNVQGWGGLDALLERLRPGEIVISHLTHSPERLQAIHTHGIKALFMVRDPRDVALSAAHYIGQKKSHALYHPARKLSDVKSRLKLFLDGYPDAGVASFSELMRGYTGWLDSGLPLIRFEDLIGPAGGGDEARQRATLQMLYRHIGVPADNGWLEQLGQRLFSSTSPTFRKGHIGEWRQHFDPELKDYFKAAAGWSVIRFGYEQNDDW